MAAFTIERNQHSTLYHWMGTSIVCWDSKEIVPVGALDHLTDVWLFLNKAYPHHVDDSKLPEHIKVCTHATAAINGPSGQTFRVWQHTKNGLRVDVCAVEYLVDRWSLHFLQSILYL